MIRERHAKAELLIPQYPQADSIVFTPAYTPARMLELGVFGGNYFAEATSDDFKKLGDAKKLAKCNVKPFEPFNNCFGVKAGLSYDEWMANGWIFDEDPLGWFHWYCRYSAGRRHPRDAHQIGRWLKYRTRWTDRASTQRLKGRVSAVIMQGLLQWSIDPWSE